jgi:hypothetical protein
MKKFYSLLILFVLFNLWCGASERSLNSEPGYKTFSGINEVPATNIQVVLTNEFTGEVTITWQCIPSAGFLHYILSRNGVQLAVIPSALAYSDILPGYGTYTYCIQAVYTTGPTATACNGVEWAFPTMVWSPAQLAATVASGATENVHLSIGNTGEGALAFEFPDYTDHSGDSPLAYCPASATDEDEFISRVQFGTIDNSSGWSGYNDFTSMNTILVIGESFPIYVTLGPPSYSGDITGLWIDFDHNNTFDAGEFFALTGTSPATGTVTVPATALSGPTTMRVRTQFNGTLSPCGTTQFGEVEDYTINIMQPTFITAVVPASGFVGPSITNSIYVSFSAVGEYAMPGVYTNQLTLSSNDPAHQEVLITAIMTVGAPGYIEGVVTDCMTGEPINGVSVFAGYTTAMTNDTGFYSMALLAGAYNLTFSKTGYQTTMNMGVSVSSFSTTTVNSQMCETPYPPACAYASVDLDDAVCTVSWCPPAGPYEMLYDDGTPENYAAWEFAGNRYAVKFTPEGYPATITGAKFFIGDGPNGNAMGSSFVALVCKPDAAGLPGQVIDSVPVSVYSTGWLSITGMNATITSGDFFIVMVQSEPAPDCPYLGVDETLPTVSNSYSMDVVNGGEWQLSAYQDFMIRAIVSGPGLGNLNVYSLARIYLGAVNPVTPNYSVFTLYNNNITTTTFSEGGTTWAALPQGWYAYGVRVYYPNGQESAFTYTNNVAHKMFADLTISAQLECASVPAGGAIATLTGIYYPFYSLTDTLSSSGSFTFSQITQGEYTLSVSYPGYETYTQAVSLYANEVIDTVLLQSRNKPINFKVTNNDLVASWQAPRGILLSQNFESSIFPPSGWQSSTQGIMGWYATTNGGSDSLAIPPHTVYAVVNDELGGAANNGCCDYLITPELDLRGAPDYSLSFNSYFNGLGGQLGFVEMSTDNGTTWNPILTCYSSGGFWINETIDLSAYSGPAGLASVKFAFHANDAGNQASGWAIDDVMVTYGGLQVSGYKVYLDGTEMGQTTGLTWSFDPATFTCQDYQAAVEAIYCTGTSEPATYDFSNGYPYPPANLEADTSITSISGAVKLSWQMPMNCLSIGLGYHIYRDDLVIAFVPITDTIYWDMNLMPSTYCYDITFVYDLELYGFPAGSTAESIKTGPACVEIIYGGDLPFFDDFSGGGFDTTLWNPGENWLVDEDSDNPVPAAKFKWDPLMTDYSSALQSTMINISEIDTAISFKIYFDYEIKLEDFAASGNEKLTVEIWNGSDWNVAKEYTNTGSFDWMNEQLDITALAGEQTLMVRFRANGISSDAIHYWAVDNVDIYIRVMEPAPINLVANLIPQSGNDIKLTWGPNPGGGTYFSYVLDDNSAEMGVSFDSSGEYWVGNKFPAQENGVLQLVDVLINASGSTEYSIDVFDANHTLIGSSAPFIPGSGVWTQVALPDIPFNGTFYIMVHMIVATESGVLSLDTNGPNAVLNLGWFYNGLGWFKISDVGFAPGVFLLRTTALVGGKKTMAFGSGSPETGYTTPKMVSHVFQNHEVGSVAELMRSTAVVDNTDSVTGYNVYRRAYSSFPAGGNTTMTGEFQKIAFVVPAEYIDIDLSNLETNCYEYMVTKVYPEGESFPSNIDWECIFVGVKPVGRYDVNLYPNPATTFIRIELSGDVRELQVYNSLGILVTAKNIAGETTVILNTSGYPNGMFTAKFTTLNGETFSRKFVVVR